MRKSLPALVLIGALLGLPASAQQSPAPEGGGLSMGVPVDGGIGAPYVKAEHGDWDIRCIRTEAADDPCQLYQLLEDSDNNPVAELAIFPLLPAQGEAIAGGNIVSPLETLLTEGVTLSIDGGEPRRYPFTFCTEIGCVARIGLASADVDRLKRGSSAIVTIVPVVAANQRIALSVSLVGFTAAYDALDAEMKAIAEAAGAASGGAAQPSGN